MYSQFLCFETTMLPNTVPIKNFTPRAASNTEMFDKQAQFYRDAPQENDNTVTES